MKKFVSEDFYDKVGKTNGWNFSAVRSISEGVEWDFYEEVVKKCKPTDVLLDIGTGGGENLMRISPSLLFLVGIDISSGMLETAHANLKASQGSNIKFFQMSSDSLQFPAGFFDIVSCCHAPFSPLEVYKVLKEDGWFMTQQVGEADKINMKKAFKRGQAYGKTDGELQDTYIKELKDAGFSEITAFEYNATDYYERPEDLLFLLTHTPIIPNFGEDKKDYEILYRFIQNNSTEKGIKTNSKRFLITAKK